MTDAPLRIPAELFPDGRGQALRLLRTYYGLAGDKPYGGVWFDRLGGGGSRPGSANDVTAEDLVAVGMLSVRIRPDAAVALLEDRRTEISASLLDVPNVDLVDAGESDLAASKRVYALFREIPGIGWVIANKLLARKRPALIPPYDRFVHAALGKPTRYWESLATALRAEDRALHRRLLGLRDEAGVDPRVTATRIFDVVTWMSAHPTPTG